MITWCLCFLEIYSANPTTLHFQCFCILFPKDGRSSDCCIAAVSCKPTDLNQTLNQTMSCDSHVITHSTVTRSSLPTLEVIAKYRDRIRHLEPEVRSILKQEEEEKQLRVSEMEVNKARNMIEHEQEIFSRPAKTWIQPSNQKPAPEGKKAPKKEKRKKPETVSYFTITAKQCKIVPCQQTQSICTSLDNVVSSRPTCHLVVHF